MSTEQKSQSTLKVTKSPKAAELTYVKALPLLLLGESIMTVVMWQFNPAVAERVMDFMI